MTDRRRNAFLLTFILVLIAAAAVAVATKQTRLGLDLQGGVQLIYQATPTRNAPVITGEAMDRAIDTMRQRVDTLGVAEPEIQRSGEDQINVSLPDVENADQAAEIVGTTAQLFFYDWEANVLGPDLEPAPTNPEVTGGPNAGSSDAALSAYGAVVRASRRAEQDYGTKNPQFYVTDDRDENVLSGPAESREAALEQARENHPRFRFDEDRHTVRTIQPGTLIVRAERADAEAPKSNRWFVLDDKPALSGDDIRNPEQNYDSGPGETGAPNVTFDFTDQGRRAWAEVTRQIAQRGQNQYFGGPRETSFQHFAIVLDDELISVPQISWAEFPDGLDGRGGSRISGGFTLTSAQNLANLLATGALPIELELISSSQVSATLGRQALDQGLIAGIAGFAVVALFLMAFYRLLGVLAVGALCAYGVLLFALVKLIPITLTLPGIAGLILTIGVAADANIVIFERVKEEIRAGRSVQQSIAAGYKKGLTAIIDANVVTFMVAFILFVLATAGVKGFAFVLGIGVIVSFTTAVLLTQAVLGLGARSRLISAPGALGAGKKKRNIRWDFMGASKWFFSASGVILLIGALAVSGKGLTFGIDFESGSRIQTELSREATERQVRDVIAPLGHGNAKVQRVAGEDIPSGRGFQISTETLSPAERTAIETALDERFGVQGQPSFQTIGPTFGQTVANAAVIAIIASLIVISAYIALRFEWKYAVPVLIAVLHDILIVSGIYSLTGREVTVASVAAILTVVGYSLYDTIIVFDRIRENVPRMPRAAFTQIANRSMSEVLVRSLATSFSTVLPVIALFLFGGETLRDFAFALIVGTLSGTYSSIFIASPVLVHWKERERHWKRRRLLIEQENDGVVPAYATGGTGADVDPDRKGRPGRRLTEPDLPGRQVSQEEFDEMVADLGVGQTAVAERDLAADASPEDVVMKDKPKRDKSGRPRNRKHGRR
jgi:SecD/SecF fusion protein